MAEDRRAATADAVYPCRLCRREFSDRSNRARHERNKHADGVGSVQPSSQSVARMATKGSCAVVQAAEDSVSPPVLPASTAGFTIHEQIRTAIVTPGHGLWTPGPCFGGAAPSQDSFSLF